MCNRTDVNGEFAFSKNLTFLSYSIQAEHHKVFIITAVQILSTKVHTLQNYEGSMFHLPHPHPLPLPSLGLLFMYDHSCLVHLCILTLLPTSAFFFLVKTISDIVTFQYLQSLCLNTSLRAFNVNLQVYTAYVKVDFMT